MAPTPDSLYAQVEVDRQPIVVRCLSAGLNEEDLLDAQKRRPLALVDGVKVGDRRLTNDFELQMPIKPSRPLQKPVQFGKTRTELRIRWAFPRLEREIASRDVV